MFEVGESHVVCFKIHTFAGAIMENEERQMNHRWGEAINKEIKRIDTDFSMISFPK